MKPVDQTVFEVPGGNCFSACIASLLHMSLEDVPYFMGDGSPEHDWFTMFSKWLWAKGFYAFLFDVRECQQLPLGLHILSGQSPRGNWLHSVIVRSNDIVHDPHPSRAGLLSHEDTIVIVPFDPFERGAL